MLRSLLAGPALVMGVLATAGIACAGNTSLFGEPTVQARLLPGNADARGTRLAGVRLSLKTGWKTYWRAPGEGGVPPVFDWSGSVNVANVVMHWPAPQIFESYGLSTIGYAEGVVLPVTLVPEDPSAPMVLRMTAEIGVCKQICILETVQAAAVLGPGGVAIGEDAIAVAMASVPRPAGGEGLLWSTCRVEVRQHGGVLHAELAFDRPVEGSVVLIEPGVSAWVSDIRVVGTGPRLSVTAELGALQADDLPAPEEIRFTILGPGLAADQQGCAGQT